MTESKTVGGEGGQVVRNVEPRGDRAIAETASWLDLAATQVRIAMEYYADYPAEIDAWLAKVDAQAAEAEELFRRRQEVLR